MKNTASNNLHSLALHKVSEVLGPTRALDLLGAFLGGRSRLSSPAELEAFGSHLEQSSSLARSVGATLRRYAALLSSVRA